jgi:hypothetical protein
MTCMRTLSGPTKAALLLLCAAGLLRAQTGTIKSAHDLAAPRVCADTSASATTYTCTTIPTMTALTKGDEVIFTSVNQNNSGSATLNVDSIGAVTIKKWQNSTSLAAGDLQSGAAVLLIYDGTNFEAPTIGNAPSGSGTVTTTGSPTTGQIPKFTGATSIGNSSLDDGVTTAHTFTYSDTGGLALTGTGADLLVGASAPTNTPGTAGGGVAVEGTAFTGVSATDGWYANSTNHCMTAVNGATDQGCILSGSHQAGPQSYSGSQQSQVTVAATKYYITGSGIATPTTYVGYQVGTTWVWRVSGIVKNANGTGLTTFYVFDGTNGTTADTAGITQAWGAAGTAVADVAELDVVCKVTSISSGTATVNCGLSPEHHLATTGWATTAVGGYNASFTFNTATSGLIFGLGWSIASGGTMPTVTIASVNAQAYNLY